MLKRFIHLNAALIAEWLRRTADELDAIAPGPPQLAFVLFAQPEGALVMASIEVLDTSAPLDATVTFLDAKGFPTTADDVPQWASDNSASADVVASEDGLSAVVTIGAPGAAIVSVSTTNDDGSTAQAQGTVTVLASDAVIGSVEFTVSA